MWQYRIAYFGRVGLEGWALVSDIYTSENVKKFDVQVPFLNTIFVSSHMYPENPEGTQVIVGSMNMGYISDTDRNRTHNLFRPKLEPIPLGHSEVQAFDKKLTLSSE